MGERLVAAGWRQGTLFTAPNAYFAHNHFDRAAGTNSLSLRNRLVKSSEKLVVASQACDIRANVQDEPYVEALVCKRSEDKSFLAKVERNSARRFVVAPETGLVAWAFLRVHLAKDSFATLTPEPWPSTPQRLERFVRWLARRYDRPAIPDPLVDAVERPLVEAVAQIDAAAPAVAHAFSRAVHDVRMSLPPTETPPFEVALVFLTRSDALTEEEADAISWVFEAMKQGLDPALVSLSPDLRILSPDEMSLTEYWATRPLFLEYLTYQGEEVEGAEPPSRG